MATGTDEVVVQLARMESGEGSFDELKAAVAGAVFDVHSTARTLEEQYGEYQRSNEPTTFEDTITLALMRRTITRAQWRELRALWRTTGTTGDAGGSAGSHAHPNG